MRTRRIHVDEPLAGLHELELPDTAARHVARVLRLRAGDELRLFDGRGGEYRACLTACGRQGARVRMLEHLPDERESTLRLLLLHGLCRGERMDTVVQKSTELGATAICPLLLDRSIVRLDEQRIARRLQHWRAISVSACEQSGRNRLPEMHAPRDLDAGLRLAAGVDLALVLHHGAAAGPRTLPAAAHSVALLIGPEGGLTPAEQATAGRAGFRPLRLGPRTLRTETAAAAALTIAQTLWGDLG